MPVLTSVLFCEGVSDQSLLTHVCFVLAIQDWSMNSHSLCQASLDLSMYACLDHSCLSCFVCLVIGNFRLVHVRLALSCSTSFYSSSTAWSTSQWTACKTNGDVWKIKSLPHIPLFLPGVNNADRIIGICCPQIKVVSALRNDQCCRSSDRLEDSSAGPGVEQPVAEDDVGGGLEASSSVKGVGKGWPMGRVEYSICKILRLKWTSHPYLGVTPQVCWQSLVYWSMSQAWASNMSFVPS